MLLILVDDDDAPSENDGKFALLLIILSSALHLQQCKDCCGRVADENNASQGFNDGDPLALPIPYNK